MKNILLVLLYILPSYFYAQFGTEQIITTDASTARYVFAADINGDGFIDALSASDGDDNLAWYENIEDGPGNFGPKKIITNFLDQTRFVTAADLDGDGDMDVLSLSGASDIVVWYENLDGLGTFSSVNQISNQTDGVVSVDAADLDGDGDMDVLSASWVDGKIAWYENIDGLGSFGPQQIITINSPKDVIAVDIDGDGDMDVLVAATAADKLLWFENIDGEGNFGAEHLITTLADGVETIFSIDIDGDGDMDVLSGLPGVNIIDWYENLDGIGNFGPQQIISTNIDAVFQIFATDLDNDGDADVLSASSADNKVAWYENLDGLGSFGPQQIISTDAEGPRSVYAADLDGDNYKDVLSASIIDSKIAWYKNLTYLGLNDNLHNNQIKLFPNPAQNILYLENNSGYTINTLKVYDVLGRLVLQKNNPTKQLDISNLDSGMLLVHLETSNGVLVKKVIKE